MRLNRGILILVLEVEKFQLNCSVSMPYLKLLLVDKDL